MGYSKYIIKEAGQEVYRSITRSYYRGTIGAILVYDITNRKSFENIQKWIDEINTYAMNDKVTILIVGNKEDLFQRYFVILIQSLSKLRRRSIFSLKQRFQVY